MYANYNFMNPRLELRIRLPSGRIIDKEIQEGPDIPPGLRFPFAEQLNEYLILGGVNYSASEQEYSLYALNLRTLHWGRIDAGATILGHGSWNSGFLWPRHNKFVVFGNRARDIEKDYRARRVNYDTVCMVELEAFGLYDNPRRVSPCTGHESASRPALPAPLAPAFKRWSWAAAGGAGRPFAPAAAELGRLALAMPELADMELVSLEGARVPVNSQVLARRWGPYFIKLLREATGINRNRGLVETLHDKRLQRAKDAAGGIGLAEMSVDPASRISMATITPLQKFAPMQPQPQPQQHESAKRASAYATPLAAVPQGQLAQQPSPNPSEATFRA
ncbi:hypothetical protein KEM52_004246, partial [Ascosphaera acerosa]